LNWLICFFVHKRDGLAGPAVLGGKPGQDQAEPPAVGVIVGPVVQLDDREASVPGTAQQGATEQVGLTRDDGVPERLGGAPFLLGGRATARLAGVDVDMKPAEDRYIVIAARLRAIMFIPGRVAEQIRVVPEPGF
jgi:hypothetical protein